MAINLLYVKVFELCAAFGLTSAESRDLALALADVNAAVFNESEKLANLSVPAEAAFLYLWNLNKPMLKDVGALSVNDYLRYMENCNLLPPLAPVVNKVLPIATAITSDLINIELLETAFAPDGYYLHDFFQAIIEKNGGAYQADGVFFSAENMQRSEEKFNDMVYRHCSDFIRAQEINDKEQYQPGSSNLNQASKYLRFIDNTCLDYPVT